MFRATFYPALITMLSMLCTFTSCKKHDTERLRIPAKSTFGLYPLPATTTPLVQKKTISTDAGHRAVESAYGAPHVQAHHEAVREALRQALQPSKQLDPSNAHYPDDLRQQLTLGRAGLRLLLPQNDAHNARDNRAVDTVKDNGSTGHPAAEPTY